MRKPLLVVLGTVIPFWLAPAVALAEGCGDYPLTEAQSQYLQNNVPDIVVPTGDVPFIERCDVDGNDVIDNNDLIIIRANRGRVPALLVATKVDKLKSGARSRALRELARNHPGMDVVGFSAVTRHGRQEILAWIDRAVAGWPDGLTAADDHGG